MGWVARSKLMECWMASLRVGLKCSSSYSTPQNCLLNKCHLHMSWLQPLVPDWVRWITGTKGLPGLASFGLGCANSPLRERILTWQTDCNAPHYQALRYNIFHVKLFQYLFQRGLFPRRRVITLYNRLSSHSPMIGYLSKRLLKGLYWCRKPRP